MTPEEADNAQRWEGMDGAIAWQLIDRHADDWGDIREMMNAWLRANVAAAVKVASMTTLSKRTGKLIGCVGRDCADCKKHKRDMRNLRMNLKALTDHVMRHLVWLDEEMKKHESQERSKRIAKLANVLEVANDAARYHGLGIDFRKDNKDKERALVMRSNA